MLPLQLPLQFCDANFVCQTFYWHILLQSCCHCCRCFCCYCSCCCWFVGLCCCCCCCLCRVVRQQTRLKLKCALFFARRARELRKQHLHILYRHRMCLCVCMGMRVSVSVCVCGFKASRLKCFMRSQARTLTVIAARQAGSQSVSPASQLSIRRSNSDDATAGGGALLLPLPMQTSFARIKGHRLVDIRLDSGQFVRTLVA